MTKQSQGLGPLRSLWIQRTGSPGAQAHGERRVGTPPPGRVWTIQHLVYYISEVLHESKTRYLKVHKLLYTVLIASRKLRHYFQAHRISVVS
jgi:hypothetical protein